MKKEDILKRIMDRSSEIRKTLKEKHPWGMPDGLPSTQMHALAEAIAEELAEMHERIVVASMGL